MGVESGTQLEPELSRLIGSARLREEAIVILCCRISSLRGDGGFSDFGVGRWTLDVGRFLSSDFIGTSGIPHFGQLPGASITTSGCMMQVYFRAGDSAMSCVGASRARVVSINKYRYICS